MISGSGKIILTCRNEIIISSNLYQQDFGEGILGKKGTAGNQGPEIRSDCYVAFELKSSGGREIILER